MTVSPQNELSYLGVEALNPPTLIKASRDPISSDYKHKIGTLWINVVNSSTWQLSSLSGTVATWTATGSGAVGGVVTLTGGSGGAISPTAGNINTLGTANQITTTGAGSTITWSLPAAITAPGSLTTTTSLVSGTTVTAGTGITSTTGNISATAGAVNAGTSMTATAGDITATLGNVIINGAAKQLRVHGGAVTDFIGQATLVAGVATVLNTNIAATDRVIVSRQGANGSTALGVFDVTVNATTSFVITAKKPADATTETGDVSIVNYFIVRQV